jgi:hypothetical protein
MVSNVVFFVLDRDKLLVRDVVCDGKMDVVVCFSVFQRQAICSDSSWEYLAHMFKFFHFQNKKDFGKKRSVSKRICT